MGSLEDDVAQYLSDVSYGIRPSGMPQWYGPYYNPNALLTTSISSASVHRDFFYDTVYKKGADPERIKVLSAPSQVHRFPRQHYKRYT